MGCMKQLLLLMVKKKKVPSSFFPEHWDRTDVLKVVGEAYENKKYIGNGKYRASTSLGITVEMYLNKDGTIATAFPKYEKQR